MSNVKQTKAFVIYCSTGCTCCSSENHYRGPFSSREIAERRADDYHKARILASQYARNGRYEIEEHEAEILPDGRIIVDNTVFGGWADDGYDEIEKKWDY